MYILFEITDDRLPDITWTNDDRDSGRFVVSTGFDKLTQWDLVAPYGVVGVGQHCFG